MKRYEKQQHKKVGNRKIKIKKGAKLLSNHKVDFQPIVSTPYCLSVAVEVDLVIRLK
jgi:hypothetical protein